MTSTPRSDPKALGLLGRLRSPRRPAWPKGARNRLRPPRQGPAVELAPTARLAFTALVARIDGDRLAKALPPGARLVSKEGDLWRWDGFVARANAPKPAAVRLEQKTRLTETEGRERSTGCRSAAAAATDRPGRRRRPRPGQPTPPCAPRANLAQDAERALAAARDALERFGRDAARREARAQSLDETIAPLRGRARLRPEATLALATAEGEDPTGGADLSPMLTAARGEGRPGARGRRPRPRRSGTRRPASRQTRLHRQRCGNRSAATAPTG